MRLDKAALRHLLFHPAVMAALLLLAFTGLTLAATAGLIWQPSLTSYANAEAELDQLSGQIRELKYRARLASDYAARSGQVQLLEEKLRQVKSEPEFVRDIEALVARSGVQITQFSSHKSEKSAAVTTTLFEFFLNGSYGSLRQFFSALPDLNEFVAIERVSLERSDQAVRAYVILRRRQRLE
jgi:Tfp pilus assembly protein PilO